MFLVTSALFGINSFSIFLKATTMLPKIPQPDFKSLKDPNTLILVIIGMLIMLGYVWGKS